MKVTEKKLEACEALLTIELDSSAMESAMDMAYQRLVKKIEIPGFRKGKAPRPILERFIGRDRLIEESLDDVLPQACADALKEENLQSFGRPGIDVIQNDPVIFKARVPLPPKIELGDYKAIRMTPEKAEVKEEVVDGMIEHLRHQKATWEPVERPVKNGDLVTLDLESNIDGVRFINQKSAQFAIDEKSNYPAPGFSQEIIGLSRDGDKTFKLKYPDDFAKVELAGKEPEFKVKVIEIKEERMPAADDEFAASLDVETPTFGALRERLTENYRKRMEHLAEESFENSLVDHLVKISSIEFPTNLLEMEYERLVHQQMDKWRSQMSSEAELEEYLAKINPEELSSKLRPLAETRLKISLALGKLATSENLTVGDDEINAEIQMMLGNVPEDQRDDQRRQFETEQAREQLHQILLSRKTLARLKAIASGEAGSAPAELELATESTEGTENKEEATK